MWFTSTYNGLIMLPSDIVSGDILRAYLMDTRHFDYFMGHSQYASV